jgi:hypothetical protein
MHRGPDAGSEEHERVFAPDGLIERGSVAALSARVAKTPVRR